MNIFEALRLSHDSQRALALQVLQTQGNDADRLRLYRQMKRELAAHAAAEERCFYLPLIEHDSSMAQARHGMAEHHAFDEMVEKLNAIELSSPGWIAQFRKLREKLFHHLDDEEKEIFQLGGKVLTEAQKTQLAKDYEGEFATFMFGKEPVSSAEGE
jgi:type I site-specific restriction endonuclease